MSELADFLKIKKSETSAKQPDWNQMKTDWLITLREFFSNIREWLSEIDQDLLSIEYPSVTIQEEHIGSYQAPSMHIKTDWAYVRIEPIARIIIGGKGRIDMISHSGLSCMLLCVSKGDQDVWAYVEERGRVEYKELNKELFHKLLKGLLS
jgi:hypothetical protein